MNILIFFEGSLNNFKNRNASNNKGLQYLCNKYYNVAVSLSAVGFHSTLDGIAEDQGNSSEPAGNDFNSTTLDLYNDVAAIKYHYYTGDPTPSSQGNISKVVVGTDATCPSTDQIDDYPGGAAHIYAKIQYFSYDSTASEDEHYRDSLYYWVDRWTSPYGSVMKSDMLMADGFRDAALALYANITTAYEMDEDEVTEFGYGGTLLAIRAALQEQELSIKDLDGEQVTALEEVVDNATSWAKVRAQNWLTLYDGRQFDNTVLHVELEDEDPPMRKTNVTELSKLYPNPVHEILKVHYINKSENGSSLQVSDITGRNVLTEPLEGLRGQKAVNVNKLMSGIYLYKIVEAGQTTFQGKFVKD